ncbi:TetR/AcrR family transcriptional regulator [Rhodococcus qingshengii]|nr:TetR/AcrR family transcriptional regulator [Rhodococcus qingshengii]MDT9664523.1 TetR/AcrR family transcriptional regulator [Rhodococcus qingshengii]MYV27858.1 TetR family transcriptional regulator [Rhodococcus erythropolis]
MTKAMTRAERKKAELRREIIDASFECFAQRGYHATGIADIATTLGIGHGTFYRYFENKRDIIDHVIDDLVAKIISALATENAPDAASTLDEYRAQVGRIAEALPRIFFDDPRIPRVLLFETTGVDADLTGRMLDLLDQSASLTAAYLHHGVECGYLRADLDVDNTAHAVNGMMLASAIQGLRAGSSVDCTALNQAISRLMFDGIRAEKA